MYRLKCPDCSLDHIHRTKPDAEREQKYHYMFNNYHKAVIESLNLKMSPPVPKQEEEEEVV